jgi:hypothetical protein
MTTGNDNLDGGDGNDWLLGERRLTGSPTDFPFDVAGDGQDTFTGGAGNDILDIGGDGDSITDEEAGDFVPVNEVLQFGGENFVHNHVILVIKVKSGSRYRNAIVQPNLGYFRNFLSALHTHDRPTGLPAGANVIHYEAPPDSPNYSLTDFFRAAGISMDSKHIGRFVPPPGKKITMSFTRNGTTRPTTKFGSFFPIGGPIPGDKNTNDVIEIRVG